MSRALIGTSGDVYADWRGRFYPRDLPAREWLGYYAAHFSTVELNSPFYRLPRAATFRAWAAAVPADFVFAVKASRFHLDLERLDNFLAALARRTIGRAVLEVRHASWLVDDVFERLARADVALCLHDWKEQPVTGPVTADLVYVRRHGTRRRYGGGLRVLQQRRSGGRRAERRAPGRAPPRCAGASPGRVSPRRGRKL